MKLIKMKYIGLCALTLWLGGCATNTVDVGRAKSIKKVALIALEIQQQLPKDSLGIKKFESLVDGQVTESPEMKGMANDVYIQTVKSLENKAQWQMTTLTLIQSNTAFQKLIEKMDQRGGLMMAAFGGEDAYKSFVPNGVLSSDGFRKLTPKQRMQLAKALEVDAVALAHYVMPIDQGFSFGNLVGEAAFTHKARVNIDVLDLVSDDPIIRIQNIDGEESPDSDSFGKISVRQKLSKSGDLAAKSALENALKQINL